MITRHGLQAVAVVAALGFLVASALGHAPLWVAVLCLWIAFAAVVLL